MSELEYTLIEICTIANVDEKIVIELVEHGILEPVHQQDQWRFTSDAISRCQRAERLRHDLNLNLHGVALALELTERNQQLRQRLEYLEHIVKKLGLE